MLLKKVSCSFSECEFTLKTFCLTKYKKRLQTKRHQVSTLCNRLTFEHLSMLLQYNLCKINTVSENAADHAADAQLLICSNNFYESLQTKKVTHDFTQQCERLATKGWI